MHIDTIEKYLSDPGKYFFILPHNLKDIKQLLLSFTKSDQQVLDKKTFIASYLAEYLAEVKPKTILVEKYFEDEDYIKDYASYYYYGYHSYGKTCLRIHFFDLTFNEHEFNRLIGDSQYKKDRKSLLKAIQREYIGYMVIRPLPNRFLGRMLIKSYEGRESRRYPINRLYNVNLFGIILTVNSLPYQEQDKSVAACSTSALWTAFNQTAYLFQHRLPSPFEITKSATQNAPLSKRSFPNDGLSFEQIADAIRGVGLEPIYRAIEGDLLILKAFTLAILRAKIPVILGIRIFDITDPDVPQFIGNHAVTITGYNVGEHVIDWLTVLGRKVALVSSRIDKIYVHDDQVGPYARMEFDYSNPFYNEAGRQIYSLATSWGKQTANTGVVYKAYPLTIVVPSPFKLRISFTTILSSVSRFDSEVLQPSYDQSGINTYVEWEIFLNTNESIKEDIFRSTHLNKGIKKSILHRPLPQFCWRAIARNIEQKPLFELVFDATDIEEGEIFLQSIVYKEGEDFYVYVKNICYQFYNQSQPFSDRHVRFIIKHFAEMI